LANQTSKNVIPQFEREKLYRKARGFFSIMNRLDREGPRFEMLQKRGEEVLQRIGDRVSPRAVYSYYDDVRLQGRELIIGGRRLSCNVFEQLRQDQIRGAFVFFINAGEYYDPADNAADQVFADQWGTAFTDAARDCLRDHLSGMARLSDEFGPGFYGMKISALRDLAELADPSRIGIGFSNSGMLVPVKASAGIYLSVSDDYRHLDRACLDCRGTALSCSYCNVMARKQVFRCPGVCSRCGRCSDAGMMKDAGERKSSMLKFPADFAPDRMPLGYAAAFDIGTTTIVGMIWDANHGRLMGSRAAANPQGEFGKDVISRITYCGGDAGKLAQLSQSVRECMNGLLEDICRETGADRGLIVKIAVCGNTTMSHLFAGYDPSSLAVAPFKPAYEGMLSGDAADFGIVAAGGCRLILLPNIAGHVGGDITAGILATRLWKRPGNTLLIDIGTNGEIALRSGDDLLVCSTAAGPAFEGAAIRDGMRAAAGALEKVKITGDEVYFKVIGEVPPVGICGSGLIDAVAAMLDAGLLDAGGRMASAGEYSEQHPGSLLCERLREGEQGREFVLVSREKAPDVVLTQQDIRQVQLAKGAVAAGVKIMLQKLGLSAADLDMVLIAGAFGNYIDRASAVRIGLLPQISLDKIRTAGNTAGTGALMAAACRADEEAAAGIPERAGHVELAQEADFNAAYLEEMNFHNG
jgi:uncharacterized 2Fe-2S/4Fe-4S cluster protein (DUF4445 family)